MDNCVRTSIPRALPYQSGLAASYFSSWSVQRRNAWFWRAKWQSRDGGVGTGNRHSARRRGPSLPQFRRRSLAGSRGFVKFLRVHSAIGLRVALKWIMRPRFPFRLHHFVSVVVPPICAGTALTSLNMSRRTIVTDTITGPMKIPINPNAFTPPSSAKKMRRLCIFARPLTM